MFLVYTEFRLLVFSQLPPSLQRFIGLLFFFKLLRVRPLHHLFFIFFCFFKQICNPLSHMSSSLSSDSNKLSLSHASFSCLILSDVILDLLSLCSSLSLFIFILSFVFSLFFITCFRFLSFLL